MSDAELEQSAAIAIRSYEDLKKALHCLDVDDLIPLAIGVVQQTGLFRLPPDGHLLVDDYQDLTPMGYQLVSLVGAATDSVTVSADENLSNMADVFKRAHPQADVRQLFRAYRHDAPVARLVSGFAAHGSTTLTPVTLQTIPTSGGKVPVVRECPPDVAEIAEAVE